jgi:oligosaccharide repeat unit polymerase
MMQFHFQIGRVTPQRALFGAWLCWLICFVAMPVSTVFYGTVETVSLFVGANLALWLGLSLSSIVAGNSRTGVEPIACNGRDVRRILWCLVLVGAVAIVAKLVDLVAYRGILSATSFADARLKMETNGSNLFSGLYFGLSPAIVAGGVLALPLLHDGRYTRISIAALLLFCVIPAFSFIYGGRSVLFMVVGLAAITWLLVVPVISRRQLLCGAGILAAAFLVTMYFFVSRSVEVVGAHVDILAHESGYTKLVPLGVGTIATMRDLPDFGRYLLYYVMSVGQYYLHGVFEFFYLVRAKGPDEALLWGRYEFTLYDQAIRAIMGPGAVPDLETYNPTSGLFSTFWGPAYIDFGYFMVIYGFIFGYLTDRVRSLVARGDLFALPLYVLLVLQIFLVPVVNGVLLAAAVILDVGFLGIWLLTRFSLGSHAADANAAGGRQFGTVE